jgi:diguanylate cyclase (GGDEF)-like protein
MNNKIDDDNIKSEANEAMLKKQLNEQSYLEDYSTSLYNKNYFIKNMDSIALKMVRGTIENKRNGNNDKTWSLLFCDIDGLKLANDTIGHIEADNGIKHIADIIKKSIRTNRDQEDKIIYPDVDGKNIPIRFGGDEFIIILPNCTKEKAVLIQERIKKQINIDKDKTKNMSLSIGIADTSEIGIPHDIDNIDLIKVFLNELISLAEKRMFKDKNKDIKGLPYEEKKVLVMKRDRFKKIARKYSTYHTDVSLQRWNILWMIMRRMKMIRQNLKQLSIE